MDAERIHDEPGDLLAHRHDDERMVERRPRSLALEDDLSLFIELRTLGLIRRDLRIRHEFVEFLVAPLRAVIAADRIATKENVEEIVRIAIVAGPAKDDGA